MKLVKYFMYSAAALAFAACSNNDDVSGGINGEASIRVKISDPVISRAIVDYTESTEVALNSIKLVLTAQTGGTDKTFNLSDYDNRAALLEAVGNHEFTGVRNPSKMEVYINTTKSSGWTTADDFLNAGLAEPLYAASSKFEGGTDTDSDGIKEYTVRLEPEHTMARLEFGGIAHVDKKDPCMFKAITIDGIILDGVAGMDQVEGWDASNAMSNVIGAAFTEATGSAETGWTPSWPENANQCYAYNIAPVTEGDLPTLKVCFSGITINTDNEDYEGIVWPINGLGYATVKNYKLNSESLAYKDAFGAGDDGIITKFPAGYIYQIKSLEIYDEAIGSGWQGGEDIHVIAEISVEPWTIAQGSVEWN